MWATAILLCKRTLTTGFPQHDQIIIIFDWTHCTPDIFSVQLLFEIFFSYFFCFTFLSKALFMFTTHISSKLVTEKSDRAFQQRSHTTGKR